MAVSTFTSLRLGGTRSILFGAMLHKDMPMLHRHGNLQRPNEQLRADSDRSHAVQSG